MSRSRAVVLLLLAPLLLPACGSDDEPGDAAPSPSRTTSAPSSAAPSVSAATTAVAVYWLGATTEPRGPRLYREFVRLPASSDPVRTAVEAMLSREPADPDHVSLWADGTTVRSVRRDGATAVVDLSRAAATNGGGSGFELFTVQQLVHTVTAADPSVTAVTVLVEGRPVETLWGAVDLTRPVPRAPAVEALGPVWIDAAEGATVSGSFGGTATVFEATVSWDVRQDGRTVQEGFSTATEGGPGRGTWTAELDVPPGSYELRAWESSAQDGRVTWLETRTVRVS